MSNKEFCKRCAEDGETCTECQLKQALYERNEAQALLHALSAQAHEVIAGKVPPEYTPQVLANEMLQHLHAAGMGKPGKHNTLWACIHEAIDKIAELDAANKELAASRGEWKRRAEKAEGLIDKCFWAFRSKVYSILAVPAAVVEMAKALDIDVTKDKKP